MNWCVDVVCVNCLYRLLCVKGMSEGEDGGGGPDDSNYAYLSRVTHKVKVPVNKSLPDNIIDAYHAPLSDAKDDPQIPGDVYHTLDDEPLTNKSPNDNYNPKLTNNDTTLPTLTTEASTSTRQFLSVSDEENQVVEIMRSTFQRYEDTIKDIVDDLNSQIQALQLEVFKQPINLKTFYNSVTPALLPAFRVPDYGMINRFRDIVKLNKSQRDSRNSELAEICSNFVELATRYGEIIVSEKHGFTKFSKSIKVSQWFHLHDLLTLVTACQRWWSCWRR
jgi:hypothetical protein